LKFVAGRMPLLVVDEDIVGGDRSIAARTVFGLKAVRMILLPVDGDESRGDAVFAVGTCEHFTGTRSTQLLAVHFEVRVLPEGHLAHMATSVP